MFLFYLLMNNILTVFLNWLVNTFEWLFERHSSFPAYNAGIPNQNPQYENTVGSKSLSEKTKWRPLRPGKTESSKNYFL